MRIVVFMMIDVVLSLRAWPVVHIPGRTKYFNGWCLRFIEGGSGASTSIIIGSFLGEGKSVDSCNGASSLCAVLQRGDDGRQSSLQQLIHDGRVMQESDSRFLWQSPTAGYLRYDAGLLEVELRDIGSLSTVKGVIDGRCGALGFNAEGWVGHRPFCWLLPCRYDVWTMASPATINGRKALGHAEFNFGKTFPKRWIWTQASDLNTGSSLLCVGGSLLPLLRNYNTWLVALRSPQLVSTPTGNNQGLLVFRTTDPGCTLTKRPIIDPEHGRVRISFLTKTHRLDLDIVAAPSSFFPELLYVPTSKAVFEKGSAESFEATIRVSVYQVRASDSFRLVDTRLFSNAALEFGGDFVPSSFSVS